MWSASRQKEYQSIIIWIYMYHLVKLSWYGDWNFKEKAISMNGNPQEILRKISRRQKVEKNRKKQGRIIKNRIFRYLFIMLLITRLPEA